MLFRSNRVLEQMGVKKEYELGSIRLSMSCLTTPEDIKIATEKIIEQYRILKDKMN